MITGASGVRVEGLRVAYGRSVALHDVSFAARPGSLLSILGPNGAGKSTLMSAIAGLVHIDAGTVSLRDRDITRMPAHERVRSGISLVPEGRGMLPALTVRENLELGAYALRRADRRTSSSDMNRVLDLFPALKLRLGEPSGNLSGGQMQMLAVARSMMSRPKILLLDEPTLGLAPIIARQVLETVVGMRSQGLTVLIVEQRAQELLDVSDEILVLRWGRVQATARKGELGQRELLELYFTGRAENASKEQEEKDRC